MISHIRGRLISLEGNTAVVEAGGVGFSLRMSSVLSLSGSIGKTVVIPVALEMSGAQPVLVGFVDHAEKRDYETLVKIPGIGSTTAIRLLPVALRVKAGDLSALDGVPGLGPSRRNKIAKWLKKTVDASSGEGDALKEVRSALVALGMGVRESRDSAAKAVRRKPGATLEQLIRFAVKG